MAFLAVAMKDTVMAANPLVVIPAIAKVPLEYIVTCILVLGVYALRQAGDLVSSIAGGVSFSTKDMSVLLIALSGALVWALINTYLLSVSIRILGLLYISKKHKFGWFSH
jgi:Gpi18-like mannosyltransferase